MYLNVKESKRWK